jgi:hypothetical protein
MKYDPADDHEPMFDLAQPQGGGSEVSKRNRSQPSVTFGSCPSHASDGRQTGLVRQGDHLVWRLHDKVTLSGTRMHCSASGATLCTVPARELTGVTTPTCTCEATAA